MIAVVDGEFAAPVEEFDADECTIDVLVESEVEVVKSPDVIHVCDEDGINAVMENAVLITNGMILGDPGQRHRVIGFETLRCSVVT